MMQCTAQLSNLLCIFVCASAAGLACATAGGRGDDAENPWPASDADLFNLVSGCAIVLGLLSLLLLWRQRQLRNSSAQALLASHGRLHRLNSEHQQVREEERRRIGRDIHDDLGQHLLTLKIDLAMLQKNAHHNYPLLARQLAMMVQNVDLSIASLRCIIDDLHPPALTLGLSAACGALLEEFSRVNDIGYDYALGHDDGARAATAAGPHDALLYRVLQETLANIARHAHARCVKVRLERPGADGAVHLDIMDDGIGMPAISRQAGCGLAGMRERLAGAGGTLEISSQPGGGTRIYLTLPAGTSPYH